MKISIIFPCFATKPSGGHKVVYEYADQIIKNGNEITCYYLQQNTFYQLHLPNPIKRVVLELYIRIFGPSKWFKLDKKIKNKLFKTIEDSDVIIATAIETVDIVNNLPSIKGKKIYFIQGFENWNHSDEEVYATYNLGMTNIVVAKWLKDIVDTHSETTSYLVPNCINTNLFYDQLLERKKHSIVFHYRSADYKGPQYAFEVIRRLEDKYKDLSVNVISIEEEPLNLPKCCTYHHSITPEEIAKINNKTQVFMCTTIEEGFGLPGLEAMACGCAVVSTSYKGVLEYAVDGENALLSSVRDIVAMVNNIVSLFEDDELRNRIVKNGIQTGRDRYLEQSAKQFEEILLECAK